MQKLAGGRDWYLFDPSDVPTLIGAYGTQFTDAYEAYVRSGVYTAKINTVRIWEFICNAQTESGSPFLLYQDNINSMFSDSPPVAVANCMSILPYPSTQ